MLLVLIFKLIKFAVVGSLGLVIDFTTTYGLKEKWAINKYLSNSVGFCISASSNYYFNRIWTFDSHNPDITFEYSSFLLVSIIGLIINNCILYAFNQYLNANFYLSKLLAIAITVIWNFLANYLITFG